MAAITGEWVCAKALSADDFAEGLLAGLALGDHRVITASQSELHRAFRRVLSELQLRKDIKVDLRDVDYDPLYQLSGWLDEFLARAQRDLLISFPNPSYERIEIQLTPDEGECILNEYGHPEAFRELSDLFIRELPRA
jgi:hypothetical protein